MRFEARELPPYGEPVVPASLRVGQVYFAVHFHDDDGLVPALEPVVFVGTNLEDGDGTDYYFQDYGSYAEGARWENPGGHEPVFHHGDFVTAVYDYGRAVDRLLHCYLLRQQEGIDP